MKEAINSEQAPQAIGPYSQAIKVEDTVYLSGQIPIDPETGNLVSEDFKEQASQVFKNLAAVANAADGSLQNFVKLNIYLTDLGNFPLVNEIMQEFFATPYPARATLEVSALPKGAQIEIEGIMQLEKEIYE